jgi:hypothetical protein
MKFSTTIILAFLVSSSAAFSPNQAPIKVASAVKSSTGSDQATKKPLYDPFGLYPENSPERIEGRLQALESSGLNPDEQTVKDPLGIYSNKNEIDDIPMSASLPFVKRPPMLDGTIPGDRGFDPFNFSSNENALQWYRTAEIKHARLAMLAAVGWPLAELFDKKIAYALELKPLLVFQDRVPSILNGGLDRTPAVYWASALGVAFAIESFGLIKSRNAAKAGSDYTPGDLGFDPLGLAGKTGEERMFKAEAELFNGRVAMLAITGFAVQEWWTQNSVINETPFFFKPINIVLEQLQDAAGNGGF